jgi:hypothetical protein
MLETIRELALEELAAAGEEHEIRGRHAAWCLDVAEEAAPTAAATRAWAWLERVPRSARTCTPRSPGARPTAATPRPGSGSRRPCSRIGPRAACTTRAGAPSPRCARAPASRPSAARGRSPSRAGWTASRATPRGASRPAARAWSSCPRARSGTARSASTCSARWPGSTADSRRRGSATRRRWPSRPSATSGSRPRSRGRTPARCASSRHAIERRSRATSASVAIAHDGGDG